MTFWIQLVINAKLNIITNQVRNCVSQPAAELLCCFAISNLAIWTSFGHFHCRFGAFLPWKSHTSDSHPIDLDTISVNHCIAILRVPLLAMLVVSFTLEQHTKCCSNFTNGPDKIYQLLHWVAPHLHTETWCDASLTVQQALWYCSSLLTL